MGLVPLSLFLACACVVVNFDLVDAFEAHQAEQARRARRHYHNHALVVERPSPTSLGLRRRHRGDLSRGPGVPLVLLRVRRQRSGVTLTLDPGSASIRATPGVVTASCHNDADPNVKWVSAET
jgi:hypothetical protein